MKPSPTFLAVTLVHLCCQNNHHHLMCRLQFDLDLFYFKYLHSSGNTAIGATFYYILLSKAVSMTLTHFQKDEVWPYVLSDIYRLLNTDAHSQPQNTAIKWLSVWPWFSLTMAQFDLDLVWPWPCIFQCWHGDPGTDPALPRNTPWCNVMTLSQFDLDIVWPWPCVFQRSARRRWCRRWPCTPRSSPWCRCPPSEPPPSTTTNDETPQQVSHEREPTTSLSTKETKLQCVSIGAGIILCLRPANERLRYIVTSSPIGCAYKKDPCGVSSLCTKTFLNGGNRGICPDVY